MVDQQELHHALLGLNGFVVLGVHNHALRHRRGTGRHGLGCFLYIDQAHAAICSNRQFLVIAEMRNVSTGFFSRMHDRAAFEHVYLQAVELYFNHIFSFRDQARTVAEDAAA